LSRLESGKIAKPSPPFLHKLASAHHISYEALMEKAGYVGKAATVREAARACGVSKSTAARWINAGNVGGQ
jgi:transcriptional regulator with XRE-family HTH domain